MKYDSKYHIVDFLCDKIFVSLKIVPNRNICEKNFHFTAEGKPHPYTIAVF